MPSMARQILIGSVEQPHLNLSEANSPSPSPVGSLQGIYLRLFSDSVAKTKAVNSSELCYPDNVHNFDLRLTGSEGILESPLTYYPPGLLCEWLITVPEGQSVELIFERFQLDPGCRDYVEVGDGMPLSGTSLGKYCGTTIPENVRSSHRNRYMWVQFYSDPDYAGRKPHRGFKATFKAVSSSGCLPLF